ncbi:hypothetical protein NKH70_23520 [Mesorhizobium sp. M0991]|uniref:hypothetical protein n=1 Tax=Mesorhizobium sp. M0991 TaxID=2957043 RepID=UPI00333CDF96
MKLGDDAVQLWWQAQSSSLGVTSRLVEIVPDMAAVPAIIGRCSEEMRLQEQFNGDGDGVKGRIVRASIRRPVSTIEMRGGIAQEGVGERDVRRETLGKGYERHGLKHAMPTRVFVRPVGTGGAYAPPLPSR